MIATVRDPQRAEALNGLPQLRIETLDMDDAASVDQLAARLAGTPIDVLFVNAGIAGPQSFYAQLAVQRVCVGLGHGQRLVRRRGRRHLREEPWAWPRSR